MNTSPTSPTTPNLELLRKAIREYQPDPSRIPFSNLKPFHDSIVELRGKNASYAAIAELLTQHGVKTSRARVAEYGRIVLEGGKKRKRRRTGENRASRKYPGHASKCASHGRKTHAGHASTDHGQCHAAAKRKFSIPFTRTAHRQRENDDSKRTGRIRRQPEIETASELTQTGKQSGDAPASPRCPARQPERPISRPSNDLQPHEPQRPARLPLGGGTHALVVQSLPQTVGAL